MPIPPRQLLELRPGLLIDWAADCAAAAVIVTADDNPDRDRLLHCLDRARRWRTVDAGQLTDAYRTTRDVCSAADAQPSEHAAIATSCAVVAALSAKRDPDGFRSAAITTAVHHAALGGVVDTISKLTDRAGIDPAHVPIANVLIADGYSIPDAVTASRSLT